MLRLPSVSFIAAIALATVTASSLAADEAHDEAAAMPPLKPSITRLHGPYAGIVGGGQSVAVSQTGGVADIGNRRFSALAGLVAGYQWRASGGPVPAYWGAETDLVSLPLLQGSGPGQADLLASIRARYGVNIFGDTIFYGTAGVAAGFGGGPDNSIIPALIAGAGIENAGSNGIRTRLEYLYSHGNDGGSNHQVRAALLVGFH